MAVTNYNNANNFREYADSKEFDASDVTVSVWTGEPSKSGWRHLPNESIYRLGPRPGGHSFVCKVMPVAVAEGMPSKQWAAFWWDRDEANTDGPRWHEFATGDRDDMVKAVEMRATEYVLSDLVPDEP